MWKKISLLLITVMILGAFAGCGDSGKDSGKKDPDSGKKTQTEDTSLQDVLDKGELIVGCDDQFPPMGFIDDDNKLTGFDLELAQLVGEKLGVEAKPTPIDWSSKEMELMNGKIDVIWNGYTINAERNKKVEFTKPYLNNNQVIAVKADSDIQKKEDLKGKVVGAQVDSSGLDALNADEFLTANIADKTEYDTNMLAMMDLKSSRLDAVVIDEVFVKYIIDQEPDTYRLLDGSLGHEYYGIGCPEGAVSLREAIDKALDDLMEDGSIDELSKKWFGENIVIRDVDKLTDEDISKL